MKTIKQTLRRASALTIAMLFMACSFANEASESDTTRGKQDDARYRAKMEYIKEAADLMHRGQNDQIVGLSLAIGGAGIGTALILADMSLGNRYMTVVGSSFVIAGAALGLAFTIIGSLEMRRGRDALILTVTNDGLTLKF